MCLLGCLTSSRHILAFTHFLNDYPCPPPSPHTQEALLTTTPMWSVGTPLGGNQNLPNSSNLQSKQRAEHQTTNDLLIPWPPMTYCFVCKFDVERYKRGGADDPGDTNKKMQLRGSDQGLQSHFRITMELRHVMKNWFSDADPIGALDCGLLIVAGEHCRLSNIDCSKKPPTCV